MGYISYFGESPGRPVDFRKAGEDAARRIVARDSSTPAPLKCDTTNCAASGLDDFVKQPAELRRILAASFPNAAVWFDRLDLSRRTALADVFNRLCRYGVWCYVKGVRKVGPGEKDIVIADRVFGVSGATPSVFCESVDGYGLIDALMMTGRFCIAYRLGASQHTGQTTLREISRTDSLHISVGPRDHFDAHVDRYSPVTKHPGSSLCPNSPSIAALTHIGRELVPEIVRKWLGVPGVQVFPEPPPQGHRPELTPPPAIAPPPVGITVQGPVKRARPRPALAEPVLSPDVVARIDRAIKEQVSPEAMLPSHVRVRLTNARRLASRVALDAAQREASNYPDARQFALDLASRMEQARRSRTTWLKVELPQYGAGDFGSRKAIAGEIRRIALVVRNYLPDRAQTLRSIVIFFGSGNAATREQASLGEAPRCQFSITDAPAIERQAARQTLGLSASVARSFIRTLGALGARGRFIPTVIDNKYWFAKLYEQITYEEIGATAGFRHPAFVMHFVPIFYGLYKTALDNFQAGSIGSIHPLWMRHLTLSGPPDSRSISGWAAGVQTSIVTGVTAHIQGDMATALERAYRSYVAKYCLAPPPAFDDFKPDFFATNRLVFERSQASFLLHLSQMGPFPVGPEFGQFLFAKGQGLAGGLDLDEVFRWREAAWQTAKRRLGQSP